MGGGAEAGLSSLLSTLWRPIQNIFLPRYYKYFYLSPGGGGGDAAVHGAVPGGAVVLAAHQLARTLAVPVTVALRVTYCGQLRGISTTHLALGAGGGGGAASPVVVCGAAAGGRVRRAAVHRAVARRAVVVAAVEIARALSVIVAVTLAWLFWALIWYWDHLNFFFAEIPQGPLGMFIGTIWMDQKRFQGPPARGF